MTAVCVNKIQSPVKEENNILSHRGLRNHFIKEIIFQKHEKLAERTVRES